VSFSPQTLVSPVSAVSVRWYLLALIIGLALSLGPRSGKRRPPVYQSWFFGRWSAKLSYNLGPRAEPQMAFPVSGGRSTSAAAIRESRHSAPAWRPAAIAITEQARQSSALVHSHSVGYCAALPRAAGGRARDSRRDGVVLSILPRTIGCSAVF